MRRTAVGILLAGFVFIFFQLEFAGVDLLIDAVGFLLIFNSAHALRKIEGRDTEGKLFGYPVPFAVALIVVSGVFLFAGGVFATILTVLRGVLEIGLFVSLQVAFLVLLRRRAQNLLAYLSSTALLLSAAVSLLGIPAALMVAMPFGAVLASFCMVSGLIAHLFTLGVFVAVFVVLRDTPQARRK